MSLALTAILTVGAISASAAPATSAKRATTFSVRAPVVMQRQVETRDLRAKHRFVRRKQRHSESLALFPFDAWYDDTTAVPLYPVPTASAEVAEPASTPPTQLPACRETVEGVAIMRGQPCHT